MRRLPEVHWTGLTDEAVPVYRRVARETGYPFDAVVFVVSALSTIDRGPPGPGDEGRRVEGLPDRHHVTARELCEYIPRHALSSFGKPARAREALRAWGLETGEDVGAIVMGCVAVGLGKRRPDEGAEDFRGLDLPLDALERRPWWKFW